MIEQQPQLTSLALYNFPLDVVLCRFAAALAEKIRTFEVNEFIIEEKRYGFLVKGHKALRHVVPF